MPEEPQQELFKFEKKPKRRFPGLGSIFPKAGFEGSFAVKLTVEKLVFIAIGVIMLAVLVYALGVERGKAPQARQRVFPANAGHSAGPVRAPQALAMPPLVSKQIVTIAPRSIMAMGPVAKLKKPEKPAAKAINLPYTVIVGTYTNKDTALAETNRLRKEGCKAFTIQSGRYYKACVGVYAAKAAAQKACAKIAARYRGAYVKLVRLN